MTLTEDIKLGSDNLLSDTINVTPFSSGSYFPCIDTLSAFHIAHIFKNIRNLFSVTHRKSLVQFMSGKQMPKSQNNANQAKEYSLALKDTVFGRST